MRNRFLKLTWENHLGKNLKLLVDSLKFSSYGKRVDGENSFNIKKGVRKMFYPVFYQG